MAMDITSPEYWKKKMLEAKANASDLAKEKALDNSTTKGKNINSFTPEYQEIGPYDNQAERDYAANMYGRKTNEDGVYEPGALDDLQDYADTTSQKDLLNEYKENANSYADEIIKTLQDMDSNIEKIYNNSDVQYQNDQITQAAKNSSNGFLNSSTTDNNIATNVANNTAQAYNNAVTTAQNNANQTINNLKAQMQANQAKYNTTVQPLEDLTAYGTDFADTMYNAATGTAQSTINATDFDNGYDWSNFGTDLANGVTIGANIANMGKALFTNS